MVTSPTLSVCINVAFLCAVSRPGQQRQRRELGSTNVRMAGALRLPVGGHAIAGATGGRDL